MYIVQIKNSNPVIGLIQLVQNIKYQAVTLCNGGFQNKFVALVVISL